MHRLLAIVTGLILLGAWALTSALGGFPPATVPPPLDVLRSFGEELASGRLIDDIIASLFRVGVAFTLSVIVAVPLGVVVGRVRLVKSALLPWINFFRSLSPIAWIPFAIIWFGIGDDAAMFIIVLATAFQLVLATAAATAAVPQVYYRVAADLGYSRLEMLTKVTLPAILPQLSTALRVAIGVAWMVVVAAEMLGVGSGLGYLIVDGRNALRMDLVVVGMITIGMIGVGLDLLFSRIATIPSVRWGFHR